MMELPTLISHNKKKILCFLLFFISLHNASSQELLLSILDSLQVDFKSVNTLVNKDSCNYFDKMTNNKNFRFKDKDVVYINSYKNFNLYLMVKEGRLNQPEIRVPNERGITNWGVKLAILFDKKIQRCYYFKYSMTLRFAFENIGNNTALIDAEFSRNIQYIVELDNLFNPLWGIYVLVTNHVYISGEAKRGRIAGYDSFLPCENNYCFKTKNLLDKNLHISTITYQELNDRLGISQSENDSIDSPIGKVDLDRLFIGSLPGF